MSDTRTSAKKRPSYQQQRRWHVCRLGLAVECKADGKAFTCRVPFVRPAENRKDIKDIIVEMTRAAAAK